MSFHMSLHVNKQNHILQEVSHYYGKEKIDITKKDRKNQKKMEQLFFEWYQAFKGFRLMKEYAEFKQIKIFNMNPDSYVDIFIKTCQGGKEYENGSHLFHKLNNERTPGKNLKPFSDGTPLLSFFLRKIESIPGIDELYVFCDGRRIKEYLPERG